jgi:hypothetical protein
VLEDSTCPEKCIEDFLNNVALDTAGAFISQMGFVIEIAAGKMMVTVFGLRKILFL